MNSGTLRVGCDLSGSLEPMGDSMVDLVSELRRRQEVEVVAFRTASGAGDVDARLALRALWAPLWRRSRGRRIDRLLPPVDVIHLAGLLTPPSRDIPLLVSLDDLRPLRNATADRQRIAQLRRAVQSGVHLVASSHSARQEIQDRLGLRRESVEVVFPAVPAPAIVDGGSNLLVNVTGRVEQFLPLWPILEKIASGGGGRLVVLASAAGEARLRAAGVRAILRPRRDAARELADARLVLHISDGARFPSLAVAALGAGVPTVATSTRVNRELLGGASLLVYGDDDTDMIEGARALWTDEPRRALLRAAGLTRSGDFAPSLAAARYETLYANTHYQWRRR